MRSSSICFDASVCIVRHKDQQLNSRVSCYMNREDKEAMLARKRGLVMTETELDGSW